MFGWLKKRQPRVQYGAFVAPNGGVKAIRALQQDLLEDWTKISRQDFEKMKAEGLSFANGKFRWFYEDGKLVRA